MKLLDLPGPVLDAPWVPHKVSCPHCRAVNFALAGIEKCTECDHKMTIASCANCLRARVFPWESIAAGRSHQCECGGANSSFSGIRNSPVMLFGAGIIQIASLANSEKPNCVKVSDWIAPYQSMFEMPFAACEWLLDDRVHKPMKVLESAETENPEFLEKVFRFCISVADGEVVAMIQRIATHFGFSNIHFSDIHTTHHEARNAEWCQVLKVSPTASEHEIQTAYRRLAVKFHPDRYQNSSEAEKIKAVVKMRELNNAYEQACNDVATGTTTSKQTEWADFLRRCRSEFAWEQSEQERAEQERAERERAERERTERERTERERTERERTERERTEADQPENIYSAEIKTVIPLLLTAVIIVSLASSLLPMLFSNHATRQSGVEDKKGMQVLNQPPVLSQPDNDALVSPVESKRETETTVWDQTDATSHAIESLPHNDSTRLNKKTFPETVAHQDSPNINNKTRHNNALPNRHQSIAEENTNVVPAKPQLEEYANVEEDSLAEMYRVQLAPHEKQRIFLFEQILEPYSGLSVDIVSLFSKSIPLKDRRTIESGIARIAAGNFASSRLYFSELIDVRKLKIAEVYICRAVASSLMGNMDDARRDHLMALEIEPRLAILINYDLARAHLDAAELAASRAQRLSAQVLETHVRDEWRRVILASDIAIQAFPEFPAAYEIRAVAKQAIGLTAQSRLDQRRARQTTRLDKLILEGRESRKADALHRLWTDSSDSFSVQATFLRFHGAFVTLEKENGQQIDVPFSRLCIGDQKWIQNRGQ
ncbi:SHD1 domain-containing protein [Rosistilla oblonga]|uniref:SHD1 domain-containing protein n=1 Tax=Rosistilla oblonga TaxID=2527990 RepID=UPI003A9852B3